MGQGSILALGSASSTDRQLLTRLIERGYWITFAGNVEHAIDLIRSTRFRLFLFNIDARNSVAFRTCREIRAISDMGIILLAESTDKRDKVEALRAGADDYVTKPFHLLELLARIRAILRRTGNLPAVKSGRIHFEDTEIDFETRRVRVCGDERRLTPKEFALLQYLASRVNKTVRHQELLQAVWGAEYGSKEQCLRDCIGRLRTKIEATPNQPKYLLNVPWVGYQLRLPE